MDAALLLFASIVASGIAAATCWVCAAGELNSLYVSLQDEVSHVVDDEALALRVRAVIVTDDHLQHGPVEVNVSNREVTLSGHHVSPITRSRVERLARQVEGVQSVKHHFDTP